MDELENLDLDLDFENLIDEIEEKFTHILKYDDGLECILEALIGRLVVYKTDQNCFNEYADMLEQVMERI